MLLYLARSSHPCLLVWCSRAATCHYMYGTRGAVKRGGPVVTDAEPTLVGTPEMLDAGFRCRQCQQLKVRCDRAYPCARCFERGVSCRPPVDVGDPSCDLVLSKANPAGMAERYFKVVQDMIENNELDRDRAIRLCSVASMQCQVCAALRSVNAFADQKQGMAYRD